jgi:hypothetical protein
MIMAISENRCIFCEELHTEGIHLRGKFICSKCESELLNAQVDEPAYQNYKEGLKLIWTDQTKEHNTTNGSQE